MIPILQSFLENKWGNTQVFYEAFINLILKPEKDITSEEEKNLTDQCPHKYKCQNPQQNIKPSPVIY